MTIVYFHALLFILHLSLSLSAPLFLPLTKDPSTNQHLTQVFHSSHLSPTHLVLDLNSPFLWLGVKSSTSTNNQAKPIPRRSIQCSAVVVDQSGPSDGDKCSLSLKNPITGETVTGELVQDVVSVNGKIPALDEWLLHVSAPSILLNGLAKSARGVLGLGRNRVGIIQQVSHTLGLGKKFCVCLSSTNNGMILVGEQPHVEPYKSMVYTPILTGDGDYSPYTINLKALKVQNNKLNNIDKLSNIQLSTVAPYSLMETKLYGLFVTAFEAMAEAGNMVRVPSVGRFEVCYGVKEGRDVIVPVIDLVLQSEMVKWRIQGHNSMVRVSDEVMCLGFLDGGVDLGASIVLGSHQLEDHLLEFDLGSSMLGFTTSLIAKQTSCSLLSSSLMHKDVQSM